ncbi:MAG: hypothetical protein ACPGO3_11365 [Magnetospiraceae bacterium]
MLGPKVRAVLGVLAGVIAPLILIWFDPGVLTASGTFSLNLLWRLSPAFQVVIWISMATYCVSLFPAVRRSDMRLQNFLAGVLWSGSAVALMIGVGSLPFSLIGLLFGVGILGFIPFLTAWAYRSRARQTGHYEEAKPYVLAGFVAPLILGGILMTAVVVQVQTSLQYFSENTPQGRELGYAGLERFAPVTPPAYYDRTLARAILTGDLDCPQDCIAHFQKLTGCHPFALFATDSDTPLQLAPQWRNTATADMYSCFGGLF